jgi:seryl-tRNA synthetase
MLQIAFIRESRESNPGFGKKYGRQSIVEDVIKLDTERRATQVELDGILAESNKLSKDIGEMMKNGEKKAAILKEKQF